MEQPVWEDFETDEDGIDFEAFLNAQNEFNKHRKAERLEKVVLEHYGITASIWASTPLEIKAILADMHDEADQYEQTLEELRYWRDEMPI